MGGHAEILRICVAAIELAFLVSIVFGRILATRKDRLRVAMYFAQRGLEVREMKPISWFLVGLRPRTALQRPYRVRLILPSGQDRFARVRCGDPFLGIWRGLVTVDWGAFPQPDGDWRPAIIEPARADRLFSQTSTDEESTWIEG